MGAVPVTCRYTHRVRSGIMPEGRSCSCDRQMAAICVNSQCPWSAFVQDDNDTVTDRRAISCCSWHPAVLPNTDKLHGILTSCLRGCGKALQSRTGAVKYE